jgi:hypothetical protein
MGIIQKPMGNNKTIKQLLFDVIWKHIVGCLNNKNMHLASQWILNQQTWGIKQQTG